MQPLRNAGYFLCLLQACSSGAGNNKAALSCENVEDCGKICEQGAKEVCLGLGFRLQGSQDGSKNAERAPFYFGRACELGSAEGCMQQADSNLKAGDLKAAFSAYARGCKLDLPRACMQEGVMWGKGQGTTLSEKYAAERYEKACLMGYDFACTNLAVMLELGRGVSQDLPRAVQLYEKACQGGDERACQLLQQIDHGS